MGGWLQTSHHELVLSRDFLGFALRLPGVRDFVLNLAQVEGHGLFPVASAGIRALGLLFNELVGVGMAMVTAADSAPLLDVEANAVSVELTVLVVDSNESVGDFLRRELVFREDAGHGGRALVNAAPGLDVAGLRLGVLSLKVNRLLANHQHLLVLHFVTFMGSVQLCLDVVLDLGLGLLARVLVLEVKRGWDSVR